MPRKPLYIRSMVWFHPRKRRQVPLLDTGFPSVLLLRFGAALFIVAASHQATAQSFTFTTDQTTYTETFDSMGSSTQLPQGWVTNDSGIVVSDGSFLAGGAYNLGTDGSSDRALGLLASPTFSGIFGTSFVNGAGQDLNTLAFTFTAEQWRTGSANAVAEQLTFQFSLNATSLTDPLAGWVDLPLLNIPELLTSTTSSFPVDGNADPNRLSISAALNTPLPWQPNTRLWVRWKDTDDAGNDSLLGIDDFTVRAGMNKQLLWNPEVSNAWDLNTGNWLEGGSPRPFVAGDNVSFTDSGLRNGGTVAVAAGGVSPLNMSVENTTGTYTFSGGPISGAGTLRKGGAGTLVLSNPVSKLLFVHEGLVLLSGQSTGSINVLGGTLRTDKDDALASVPAIAIVGGGILDLAGHNDSIQELYLTGATFSASSGVATFNRPSGLPFIMTHPSDAPSRVTGELSTASAYVSVSDGNAPEDLIFEARLAGPGYWSFFGKGTVTLAGDTSALTGSLVLNGAMASVSSAKGGAGLTEMINEARLRASVPLTGDSAFPRQLILGAGRLWLEGEAMEFAGGARFAGTSYNNTVATSLFVNNHTTVSYPVDSVASVGPEVLVKNGAGTLTLTGKRSGIGKLTVTEGVVEIQNDNVRNAVVSLTPASNGTATLKATGSTTTLGMLTTTAGSVIVLGDSARKIDSELVLSWGKLEGTVIQQAPGVTGSLRIASGSSQFLELGPGTSASYSGSTIIGEPPAAFGHLNLRGSISGTSSVAVAGILSGDGSLSMGPNGTAVIRGTLDPTSDRTTGAPGVLKILGDAVPEHTLSLRSSATLAIALGSTAFGGTNDPANIGKNDQIDLTGNLLLESPRLLLTLRPGFRADLGDLFFILLNDGQDQVDGIFRRLDGSYVDLPQGAPIPFVHAGGRGTFEISYVGDSATNSFTGGNDIVLRSMTAVPEPSSIGLLALGSLLLSQRRARSSRNRKAGGGRNHGRA